MDPLTGAVDLNACGNKGSWGQCYCGRCAMCGRPKHIAIHGPSFGQPPGSEPWGHEYVARDPGQQARDNGEQLTDADLEREREAWRRVNGR